MKNKEVLIAVSEELFPQFSEHWFSEDTQAVLGSTFPADIRVMDVGIVWPQESQLKYLQSIGVVIQEPNNYRMRIGSEVQEIIEHIGGVELPSSVLQNVESFQLEVVKRLREAIGEPENN